MDLRLKGLRVAVAGATRGLGLHIATAFSQENANVWISGRNTKNLATAQERIANVQTTLCDLETSEGRSKLRKEVEKKWQSLDILVLNIGSGKSNEKGLSGDRSEWDRVFDLNFLTHFELIREFRPLLKLSALPAIVSISSIASQTRTSAPVSYAVAKSALNSLCVFGCEELARDNIRFNVIAPGNIFVPGGRWDELSKENPEQVKEYIDKNVPLKRFATPDEIAAWVLFVSSPVASFATGSIVRVDGGQAGVN